MAVLAPLACGGAPGVVARNVTDPPHDDSDAGTGSGALAAIFGPTHDEGLATQDLVVGTGTSIQMGDMARAHYVGRLKDGTEFDSSRSRGEAFNFTLGKGMVIKGFERGMVGMKAGGVRRISIPWVLGYGERGAPPKIPPKADLVFEVELLDIPVPPPKAAKPKAPMTGPGGQ